MSQHIILCRDKQLSKLQEPEKKNLLRPKQLFVAIRKIMSLQTLAEQGHEKLGTNKFGVATQGILVSTRTRLLNTNYVATLSKYVTAQSKSKPREQVATEDYKLRQRPATKT